MAIQESIREAIEDLGPGFELVRELGRGATAVVYLVRDHELDRDLAVKVIRSSYAHDAEAVARLQREAKLVAQLQHPNIVRVFTTAHLKDGSLALLMEHVPGRNLKEVLQSGGPFSTQRALGVLQDVASALAYAHRRRIVHRDVKPENIYLDEEVGTARLADFGIARPWDRDARLTVPGEALGTPAYMSPEQIDGEEVDGRTDVYSLGLVGYEMLAGEHPWESDNLFNIIFKQKNESLPPLDSLHPDVPRDLARVLEKALEKERDRRWDSADALLAALEEIHADEPPEPAAVTPRAAARFELDAPPRRPPRRRKRTGRLWKYGIAVTVVGAAAWGWLGWRGRTGPGWESLPFQAGSSSAPPSQKGGPESPTSAGTVGSPPIEIVGDGFVSASVGASVPLTVRVPSPRDSTAVVRFRVMEGSGTLDRQIVAPDGTGEAEVNLTLPGQPGVTVVAALFEGPGTASEAVRFDVVARAGPPREVVPIVGDGQSGEPEATLAQAIGVRVVDGNRNPVPGVEVSFQVLVGDGEVAPPRAQTDSLGRVFARWRLGSAEGDQRIAALVPSAEDATVVFRATARTLLAARPGLGQAEEPPELQDPTPVPPPIVAPAPGVTARVSSRPLAVGGTHMCLIDSRGFSECMGAQDRGQVGGPSAVQVRFIALAAGVSHTCGLGPSGRAYCWGANEGGQLGNGSLADGPSAAPVDTPAAFSALALGLSHTCGLDSAGHALCWGRNVNGQLGDGTRDDRTTPVLAQAPAGLSAVTAGWNHTCAVAAGSGQAYCWGLNAEGQLGEGSRVDRIVPTPVSVSLPFNALAAGNAHTCGLSRGVVYCWGANGSGQLGIGRTGGQTEPVRLEGLPGSASQVVAGAVHTCALLQDGRAWCWGQNTHGQLGDGTNTNRALPTAVEGDLVFRSLEAGGGSTCGITGAGQIYCWGLNQSGQLGDGTRTNRSLPTRVGV